LNSLKEPGSAITHFFGIPISIVAAFPLIKAASKHGDLTHILSIITFVSSMFLLYTASTIYHSIDSTPKINDFLKKFDHCMVFILIAGSYTPVSLISMGGRTGTWFICVVWGIALLGCISKLFFINMPNWLTSTLYIFMGWICVICFPYFFHSMPLKGFLVLLTGGILYTIGGIIYCLDLPIFHNKYPNFGAHELFHLFILAGSILHIFFMYYYICPMPLKKA